MFYDHGAHAPLAWPGLRHLSFTVIPPPAARLSGGGESGVRTPALDGQATACGTPRNSVGLSVRSRPLGGRWSDGADRWRAALMGATGDVR